MSETKNIPKQLATPTDLTSKQTAAVADAINPLIADAFALYVKTKNFHWHLSGPHFRDYHILFDEQADDIFASIDILAERVRKVGQLTITSIGHIAGLTAIKDQDKDFLTAEEMIKELLADNQTVAQAMRAAIDVCDDNDDKPTGNLLQDMLDKTERRIWFLYEITQ